MVFFSSALSLWMKATFFNLGFYLVWLSILQRIMTCFENNSFASKETIEIKEKEMPPNHILALQQIELQRKKTVQPCHNGCLEPTNFLCNWRFFVIVNVGNFQWKIRCQFGRIFVTLVSVIRECSCIWVLFSFSYCMYIVLFATCTFPFLYLHHQIH